jgi:hypothetical protein
VSASNDLNSIQLPGPFRRDDVLGYDEANKIRDGVGTVSNVIQLEMDSQGRADSRSWLRANALYYLSGGNYVLSSQSREAVFPAAVPWLSAGVIDIVFDTGSDYVPISDSTYEVFFQPMHDGSGNTAYSWSVAGDATYKTASGVRVFVSSTGGSPTGVNPYGFSIGIAYGT